MALPTGQYKGLLLWAQKSRSGKSWQVDYVLENGERGKAYVLCKGARHVFTGLLTLQENGRYEHEGRIYKLALLNLEFNQNFPNTNRMLSTVVTRNLVPCDILRTTMKDDYAEFDEALP